MIKFFLVIALCVPVFGAEEVGARAKALAEAAKAGAEAARTSRLSPYEAKKLSAETEKLFAEAHKLVSEANLNQARTAQIWTEIERLRQRMAITHYEFQRIIKADHEMESGILRIEQNAALVRPLFLGQANVKTWIGLEGLIQRTGQADIFQQVMFEIVVPALEAELFVPNSWDQPSVAFPGGNLGELYLFARDNDLSFRKFGKAHREILRVLAMINKSAEMAVQDLRNLNQSIRLTIAKID